MDEEIRRTPSFMKDCVKRYFYEGWTGDPTRQENHRIVAWLVLELHRMRIKDEEVIEYYQKIRFSSVIKSILGSE